MRFNNEDLIHNFSQEKTEQLRDELAAQLLKERKENPETAKVTLADAQKTEEYKHLKNVSRTFREHWKDIQIEEIDIKDRIPPEITAILEKYRASDESDCSMNKEEREHMAAFLNQLTNNAYTDGRYAKHVTGAEMGGGADILYSPIDTDKMKRFFLQFEMSDAVNGSMNWFYKNPLRPLMIFSADNPRFAKLLATCISEYKYSRVEGQMTREKVDVSPDRIVDLIQNDQVPQNEKEERLMTLLETIKEKITIEHEKDDKGQDQESVTAIKYSGYNGEGDKQTVALSYAMLKKLRVKMNEAALDSNLFSDYLKKEAKNGSIKRFSHFFDYGIDLNEGKLYQTKRIENKEKQPVLTFEEFSTRTSRFPRYNNFQCFFNTGVGEWLYRQKPEYIRFQKEHPELAVSLCEKVQKLDSSHLIEELKSVEPELYEAYKIMRQYVKSDEDLFA